MPPLKRAPTVCSPLNPPAGFEHATLAAMTTALPGVYRLTFQDWLAFPDDGRLYEVVEGELYVTPPPNVEHQRISRELEFCLLQYLRSASRGEVFDAPIGVRLSDDNVVEPDLVVVLAEHADRVGKQAILGVPDLVVEILSPGSAKRDLGIKREQYEASGVQEYWIVDPESRSVEVLTLDRGRYARVGLFRNGDRLASRLLPDLTIDLEQVFPPRSS